MNAPLRLFARLFARLWPRMTPEQAELVARVKFPCC